MKHEWQCERRYMGVQCRTFNLKMYYVVCLPDLCPFMWWTLLFLSIPLPSPQITNIKPCGIMNALTNTKIVYGLNQFDGKYGHIVSATKPSDCSKFTPVNLQWYYASRSRSIRSSPAIQFLSLLASQQLKQLNFIG